MTTTAKVRSQVCKRIRDRISLAIEQEETNIVRTQIPKINVKLK